MKALSVRQPWASLIASGTKTIEVRSWRTNFRGTFVLCSSASKPSKSDVETWDDLDMPVGVTLAVCELVDVVEATAKDARAACCVPNEGDFAWHVRVVELLEQVPVKGSLGFWKIDARKVRSVRSARKAG